MCVCGCAGLGGMAGGGGTALLMLLWAASAAAVVARHCPLPPIHPQMSAPAYKERCAAFLGRLTHLTLSSNDFSELPAQLLLHATALRELDLAYNRQLQMSAEAADAVAEMGRWVNFCYFLLEGVVCVAPKRSSDARALRGLSRSPLPCLPAPCRCAASSCCASKSPTGFSLRSAGPPPPCGRSHACRSSGPP